MIKINLVPVKEKKKRREFFIIVGISLVFLVLVMGMFSIWIKRVGVKTDLLKQIDEVKKESESYQDKINEVKELGNKEASLEAFKNTIKGIAETQRKVVVALDQLAMDVPDGVWMISLSQGRGNDTNKFIVDGYAFNQLNLQNYFNAIKKPGGLLKNPNLDLKSISASVGQNKQIHQFEITVTVADQGS